jgi:hypothetical protein
VEVVEELLMLQVQQELVELVQLLYKVGQLTFKLLAEVAHQAHLVVVVVAEEVVLYL